MLLHAVEIDTFRNFTNKQTMMVDAGVTCLIGKNESGKTTIVGWILARLGSCRAHKHPERGGGRPWELERCCWSSLRSWSPGV
ncbi:AAA family ATPase [Streptomyces sp. NPDC102278]|uniref:AAA family ATPase n=1 Tax=Streptomyces sp. NPDC102278 TaxID=3366152 RepID=UPI0037F4C40C